MTIKKQPQIRFGGFGGDWEVQNIGEVLSEVKRNVYLQDNQTYQLVTVKRRNEGVVSRGKLLGKDILVKNYSQIQTDDYVISKRQIIHGANGLVPSELNEAIVSNEYLVAVSNDKITTEFLALMSRTPEMYRKFLLSSYGVDIEKMVFNVEDWKKREITLPEKPEQIAIGQFFRQLDEMLTLAEQKHAQTVQLKKALLGKLFPISGSRKPQIRLKGFSGDWVERKLGDVSTSFSGGTPSVGNANFYNGNIPFIRSGEISKDKTELFITELGLNNSSAKMVKKGDILYALYGATSGEVARSQINGAINQAILAILVHQEFDAEFVAQYLRSQKQNIINVYLQGGQGNLSAEIVKKIIVRLPETLAEQTAIGKLFQTLDHTIALQAKEITQIKQLKSALLGKMFV